MKKETADELVHVFSNILHHTQEYFIKVTALERAIGTNPQLLAEYQTFERRLRSDPTVRRDHQETAKKLEALRAALTQD